MLVARGGFPRVAVLHGGYRRLSGKTVLPIAGEMIALRHEGSDDPSRLFLIGGTPFLHNDWRFTKRWSLPRAFPPTTGFTSSNYNHSLFGRPFAS